VPLGEGTNGIVQALAADGAGALYVAGDFTEAGAAPANNIAGYLDSTWFPLTIVPVQIEALTASNAGPGTVRLHWRLPQAGGWRSIAVERAEKLEGPYVSRTSIPLEPAVEMTWEDSEVSNGTEYWYRLALTAPDGTRDVSQAVPVRAAWAIGPTALDTPRVAAHGQISIAYDVGPGGGSVRLDLFDVRGRHVRALASGSHAPGRYVRTWDRRDSAGHVAARGIYHVRLQWGSSRATRKLLLLAR
jgi:hypothetical protein